MKTKEIIKITRKIPGPFQVTKGENFRLKDVDPNDTLERIDDPQKNWKFSVNDASERDYWDQYMDAYQEMISQTASKYAPWYVVPADNKWFTRVVVAAAVIEALADLDLAYPKVSEDKLNELVTAKNKLLKK
jgi:hypothetical protein